MDERNGIADDQIPIVGVAAIFEHFTANLIKLRIKENFLAWLSGRPLRVATVCSGTESPLLALNEVAQSKSQRSDLVTDS